MMKKTLCALAVIATSATALNVHAANTTDLKIIGQVVPAACTPSLDQNATVNYGTITADSLATTGYTTLQSHELGLTITCQGASAPVALTISNGRAGTVAGATEGLGGAAAAPTGVTIFNAPSTPVVGLGTNNGKKTGGYGVRIVPGSVTMSSKTLDSLQSAGNTSSWTTSTTGNMYNPSAINYISFADAGLKTPADVSTLTAKLGVQAYLNQKSELDLSKSFNLDGLSTIELVYL